jgi:hypothetical protein
VRACDAYGPEQSCSSEANVLSQEPGVDTLDQGRNLGDLLEGNVRNIRKEFDHLSWMLAAQERKGKS